MNLEKAIHNIGADRVAEIAAHRFESQARTADKIRSDEAQFDLTYFVALRLALIEAHVYKHYNPLKAGFPIELKPEYVTQAIVDKANAKLAQVSSQLVSRKRGDGMHSLYRDGKKLVCRKCGARANADNIDYWLNRKCHMLLPQPVAKR